MNFFKRLFGKSARTSAVAPPTARRWHSHSLPMDQLIPVWRKINAADRRPWVLFENGTCVWLTHADADVFAQARAILKQWGPVIPGSPSGDFNVERAPNASGWLVTSHHPDIATYVSMSDEEPQAKHNSDSRDLVIGLRGRSLRDRDASAMGVIHIEDHRPTRISAVSEAVLAWTCLAQRAWQARHENSDWVRYAVPIEAVGFLTAEQANHPQRVLHDIPMPPEARAQVAALESIVRKFGRLPQPVTVLSGLVLAGSAGLGATDICRLFAPGQVVELRGFLSGSASVAPPLYAAGMDGAMLEINVHSAAEMFVAAPRRDETEYLLPRDCRCRVRGTKPDFPYRAEVGGHFPRTVVELEQL